MWFVYQDPYITTHGERRIRYVPSDQLVKEMEREYISLVKGQRWKEGWYYYRHLTHTIIDSTLSPPEYYRACNNFQKHCGTFTWLSRPTGVPSRCKCELCFTKIKG